MTTVTYDVMMRLTDHVTGQARVVADTMSKLKTAMSGDVVLSLKDKVSGAAQTLAGTVDSLKASMSGDVVLGLKDRVSAQAERIGASVDAMTERMAASQERLSQRMDGLSTKISGSVGHIRAFAEILRAPIEAAMGFEEALAPLGEIAGTTAANMETMKAGLLDMAQVTPVPIEALTDALKNAREAGLNVSDAMAVTQGAARLGVAAMGSTADATTLAAHAISAFNLEGAAQTGIYDVLFKAVSAGQTSLSDMADGFEGVASTVAGAGIQVDEYLAAVATMSAAGKPAAETHEHLGGAIATLSEGTEASAAIFAKLGASGFQDLVSQSGGVMGAFQRLREATGGNEQAMAGLVGSLDAARTVMALTEGDGAAVSATLNDMRTGADAITPAFDNQANTFGNTMQQFHNQVNVLKVTIGEALLPPLNQLLQAIAPVIQSVGSWIQVIADLAASHPQLVQAIALGIMGLLAFRTAALGVQWATLGMGSGILRLGTNVLTMGRNMMGVLPSLNLVRGAFTLLRGALISTGIGAIVVALGAAAAFVVQNWDGVVASFQAFGAAFMEALGPVKPLLDPVFNAFSDLWTWIQTVTGPMDTSTWVAFGQTIGSAVGGAVKWVVQVFQMFQGWFQDAIDAVVGMIPEWLREKMGITVTPKVLTQEEMEERARERAEDARDEADTDRWSVYASKREASEQRGQEAYEKEYAASMAEMRAQNARIETAQEVAALDFPEEPAPIYPPEPATNTSPASPEPEPTTTVSPASAEPEAQRTPGIAATSPEPTPLPEGLEALGIEPGAGGASSTIVPAGLNIDPSEATANLQAHFDQVSAGLQMQGKVNLDLSDMDRLMQYITQAKAALSGLGVATRDAAERAASSLDRSRATNLQDRPTTTA